MMRLVLFDIDGTLLMTGGVGQSSAQKALERVFGTSGRLDAFYPGGRTIEAILIETLRDAGISMEEILAKRDQFYEDFLREFKQQINEERFQVRPCPGAMVLIEELRKRKDILLGLLTGNHRETAILKLQAAGFDFQHFHVGAYGDESTERPALIPIVQDRAAQRTNQTFSGHNTVVIGDTTRDVASAKAANAYSIAVATGTDDIDQLKAAQPEYLFENLEKTQVIMTVIIAKN